MTKPAKQKLPKQPPQEQKPPRKRGRPEKLVKIDDTPRNVARALFGIPSDKFTSSKS